MTKLHATNYYRDFLAKEFPVFGIQHSYVAKLADVYDIEFGLQAYQALTDDDSEHRLTYRDSHGRFIFEAAADEIYNLVRAVARDDINTKYDSLAFKLYTSLMNSEAEASRIFYWADKPLIEMLSLRLAHVWYEMDITPVHHTLIELVSRGYSKSGACPEYQLSFDDWCGAALIALALIRF